MVNPDHSPNFDETAGIDQLAAINSEISSTPEIGESGSAFCRSVGFVRDLGKIAAQGNFQEMLATALRRAF